MGLQRWLQLAVFCGALMGFRWAVADDATPFYAAGALDFLHINNAMTTPKTVSSPSAGSFLLGYRWTPYLGMESEGQLGLGQAQAQYCVAACSSAQVSLLNTGSVWIRLQWPIGRFEPYFRAGVAIVHLQTTVSGVLPVNQVSHSAAVGAGIGLHLDAERQLFLDVQHLKAHETSIDIVGLGYSQRFSFSGR